MSFKITEAFVEQFKSNIYMLSQQMDSKLFGGGKSRAESQNAEVSFFDRIGTTDAFDIVERHGDTPLANSEHSRRGVTIQAADWGDLIDSIDRVKLLINPDDAYTKAAVAALNRKKDDIFIAAALGSAMTGKQGGTFVALPATQKLVAIHDDKATGAVNMSVLTLTLVQAKFDAADIDESLSKYFAWTGSQKQSMLNETKVTSSDYASVQALTTGKINNFMGFEFIRSQRLPIQGAGNITYSKVDGSIGAGAGTLDPAAKRVRRCFAWVQDGMVSSTGEELFVDVGPRKDKRLSTQIYVRHAVGAVRMEEEKVVEIYCQEN